MSMSLCSIPRSPTSTSRAWIFLASGNEPRLNAPKTAIPRGRFASADGFIAITAAGNKMFRALCTHVVERPEWLEDPRFATTAERMRNAAAFLAAIEPIFRGKSSAEWSALCKRAGIPCGAVRSVGEALLSDEAIERGAVFDLPHPTAGTVPAIAQPYQLSRTPCDYRAPPTLGADTAAVLGALPGYDESRIAALADQGAIGVRAREEA